MKNFKVEHVAKIELDGKKIEVKCQVEAKLEEAAGDVEMTSPTETLTI